MGEGESSAVFLAIGGGPRFMVPMHVRKRKGALHEPNPQKRRPHPGPLPIRWERENRRQSFRQSDAGPRFMVPMHARRRNAAFHEQNAFTEKESRKRALQHNPRQAVTSIDLAEQLKAK